MEPGPIRIQTGSPYGGTPYRPASSVRIPAKVNSQVEWWSESIRLLRERVGARIDAYETFSKSNPAGDAPFHVDQLA